MAAAAGGAGAVVETAVPEPPKDGISSARWAPAGASQDLLVAASWDTKVHVYDTAKNELKVAYAHKAPVLDATFVSATAIASGGLDMSVKLFDLTTSTATAVGRHDAPVRTLEWAAGCNLLFSGSWDSTCNAWDLRAPGEPAYSIVAPGKVYSSSLAGAHMLVLATAGRRVEVHDLRKVSAREGDSVLLSRETNLKHQTRCVRAMTDASGYIVSSIEGRCGVEWIDAADNAKKYAFKCHRFKLPTGDDRIFPVNAMAFHPVFGSFLTGGGDGTVVSWDYKNRKRLTTVRGEAETSISYLSFNWDGTKLATAVSYTWEQGEREHPADALYVRKVTDDIVKLK